MKLSFIIIISLFIFSCTANKNNAIQRSLHGRYSESLKDAGLESTSFGTKWFTASNRALNQPLNINISFKETGYFAAEQPSAAGFRFTVKQGERLVITAVVNPASKSLLFVDLWELEGVERKFEESMDSVNMKIELDVDEETSFILRLQPKLLESLEYTITISTAPSLAFPVRSADNPKVSSFWGAARDGGARSHEGIDIFAKRGTPVVAVADGTVSRVNENNLGGKVIFMKPNGKNLSVYYAHLDSQIARPGQRVKAGDIIGLIGNTGNAKSTSPHLHFGIYTSGGAVDPYPFVNMNKPSPPSIKGSKELLGKPARLNKEVTITMVSGGAVQSTLRSEQSLDIIAANDTYYKVRLPDGMENYVNIASVSTSPLRSTNTITGVKLLQEPNATSAPKAYIPANSSVTVKGKSDDFLRVEFNNLSGWIPAQSAR